MNNPAYKLAQEYIGTNEIIGSEDNPIIVKWFADAGEAWVKDDETAWCGAFMGAMHVLSGMLTQDELQQLTNDNPLGARNWLRVGTPVEEDNVKEGDLAIFWRGDKNGWQGHVGMVVSVTDTHVYVLGGNQANGVNIKPYPKNGSSYGLLGYRRIETNEKPLSNNQERQQPRQERPNNLLAWAISGIAAIIAALFGFDIL